MTISNTTAHMAGALGVPCFVIVDDLPHLIWPVAETKTPFYPSVEIVRRQGRDWPAVFADLGRRLRAGRGACEALSIS